MKTPLAGPGSEKEMFRRLLILSAAFVLLTGVAATAHAEYFSVNNSTGKPAHFDVTGVKVTPHQTYHTDRVVTVNGSMGNFSLEDGYHWQKIYVFAGSECHETLRKPGSTDWHKKWIVNVFMDKGHLTVKLHDDGPAR